jgi:ketosteroid isomerase-like protein
MASENEELYRHGVNAFNRRDLEAWMEDVDPEVVSVPPRDWPEPAPVSGARAVWDIMVANMGIFENAELKIVGPVVEGEGTLVATLQGEVVGKESGASAVWSFHQLVTFRDGRAARFDWFVDRAEALEAAGIAEPAGEGK